AGHLLWERVSLNTVRRTHVLHAAQSVAGHSRNKGEVPVLLESGDADVLLCVEGQEGRVVIACDLAVTCAKVQQQRRGKRVIVIQGRRPGMEERAASVTDL